MKVVYFVLNRLRIIVEKMSEICVKSNVKFARRIYQKRKKDYKRSYLKQKERIYFILKKLKLNKNSSILHYNSNIDYPKKI